MSQRETWNGMNSKAYTAVQKEVWNVGGFWIVLGATPSSRWPFLCWSSPSWCYRWSGCSPQPVRMAAAVAWNARLWMAVRCHSVPNDVARCNNARCKIDVSPVGQIASGRGKKREDPTESNGWGVPARPSCGWREIWMSLPVGRGQTSCSCRVGRYHKQN